MKREIAPNSMAAYRMGLCRLEDVQASQPPSPPRLDPLVIRAAEAVIREWEEADTHKALVLLDRVLGNSGITRLVDDVGLEHWCIHYRGVTQVYRPVRRGEWSSIRAAMVAIIDQLTD